MLVDLVTCTTPDGGTLEGCLSLPATVPAAPAFDAVCLVHGAGGNFYSSTFFQMLAERFAALGTAALRINTRGHDGISTFVTKQGNRKGGAAFEIVDDCRHDLAGWTNFLRERGYQRLLLLGHSLGAIKALYAVANGLTVEGLVALSPPRLSYSWFCQGPRGAEFVQSHERAEALIEQGKPETLIEVGTPLPMHIAAAAFREKHGPAERYNYLNFLHAVRCPALILFGDKEVADNRAFQQAPEEVQRWRTKRPNLDVDVIANADHFYTGVRDAVWQRLETWCRRE